MRRCLACVMIVLLVFVAPAFPAGAAGFELPEGTQLSAQSVYIVNLDTGLCVYEQNADEKRSVASLTKLMTALLLIENVEDLEGTYISVSYTHLDVYKRQVHRRDYRPAGLQRRHSAQRGSARH